MTFVADLYREDFRAKQLPATGPDFVSHYQIIINTAPVTATDAITGTTVTIALPGDVEYNGGSITASGTAGGGTGTFVAGSSAQGGTVNVSLPSLGSGTTTIDIPI